MKYAFSSLCVGIAWCSILSTCISPCVGNPFSLKKQRDASPTSMGITSAGDGSPMRRLQTYDAPAAIPSTYTPPHPVKVKFVTNQIDTSLASQPQALELVKDGLLELAQETLGRTLGSVRATPTKYVQRGCAKMSASFSASDGKTYTNVCTSASPAVACGEFAVPDALLAEQRVCDTSTRVCTVQPAGTGYTEDMLIFVRYEATSEDAGADCQVGTSATADTCEFESAGDFTGAVAGAPKYGSLTVCDHILQLNTGKTEFSDMRATLSTVIHEVFHALEHTATVAGKWRNATGEYYTPASAQAPDNYPIALTYYAQPSVLEFESGDINTAYLKTPKLLEKTRNFFKCQTLTKVAIENVPQEGTQYGHYEQSWFNGDLMAGYISTNQVLSAVTVALMEDTGYFTPDYDEVGEPVWNNGKFHAEGNCAAQTPQTTAYKTANRAALVAVTNTSPYCYATTETQELCSADLQAVASCGTTTSGPAITGESKVPLADHQCTITPSSISPTEGETFGESSRCFRNTPTSGGGTYAAASCYRRSCAFTSRDTNQDPEWSSLTLTAQNDATVTCAANEHGTSKPLGTFGNVYCPHVGLSCFGAPCQNNGFLRHARCICLPGLTGIVCNEIATVSNRNRNHHGWVYNSPGHRLTLWKGRTYNVTHTITTIGTGYKFTLMHGNLPTGLSLNEATGTVSGVALETTSACTPYSIRVWKQEGTSTYGSNALLWLRVINQASDLPSSASDACHTYKQGATATSDELTAARAADNTQRSFPTDAVAALYANLGEANGETGATVSSGGDAGGQASPAISVTTGARTEETVTSEVTTAAPTTSQAFSRTPFTTSSIICLLFLFLLGIPQLQTRA